MNLTKRSLITSILALFLCFSMLLGTTLAWFTDVATSSNNIIKSGNLDLEVYWTDDLTSGVWNDAEDVDEGPIFGYENWEPGYTSVRYVKIVNSGNLAFKYSLNLITEEQPGKLGDVIDVYYVSDANSNVTSLQGMTKAATLNDVIKKNVSAGGVLLPEGQTKEGFYSGDIVVAIALHMQESAGNGYQGESVGTFAIQLLATQYSFESDAFGDDYDSGATFPEIIDADVVLDVPTQNGIATQDTNKNENGIDVTVKADTLLTSDKVSVKKEEVSRSEANVTLGENDEIQSLDVHATGVSPDNTVPLIINLGEVMPRGLNIGNYSLYHVEKGVTVQMTSVSSVSELDVHNEFFYDPATGELTVAMATFSEIALVADTVNAWNGTIAEAFAGGDGTENDPYLIANADQLALLGELISNNNENYGDKHYKLIANINLGGAENVNNGIVFYPIGYTKVGGIMAMNVNDAPSACDIEENFNEKQFDGGYRRDSAISAISTDENTTVWYTYGGAFKGVFDGNGNTIENIYQNTWQMRGNYDGHYYKEAMGIFGYVYGGTVKNLTVRNFTSDGEYTPTGVIAAYAAGNSTFENIAITGCNPRVYNTGNGGIIGIAGSTSAANDDHITLKNITVDNSNKISALWGSWDVACGGLVGMYRGNVDGKGNATGDTISFENCHVSAQIDVYNDVCANYQYYAYRYAGMIIGSVRHNTTNADGRTIPNMTGISANGCTVNFGDWNDYYYCEFEKNTLASYSPDYQFSRIPHSELIFTDSNGNGVVDADERDSVIGCNHDHTDAEDKRAVYLPFHQLFTGYSWGVSSIGLAQYSGIVTDLDIVEGEIQESVIKFEGKVDKLTNYTTIKLGDIFNFVNNGVELVPGALTVGIVNKDENNPVSATIVYDSTSWENGTITFVGTGKIQITIQDYYFCTPTTITVDITEHEHAYDNTCDTTCNKCGEERTIEHIEGNVVVENNAAPDCTNNGSYDNVVYCTVCGDEISRETVTVEALGHTKGEVVVENNVAPDCIKNGSYDNVVYCTVCGDEISRETVTVDALGHDYESVVTDPDCDNGGYTTFTCKVCGYSYTDDHVEATGHSYNKVVTAPTCTTAGFTTYTCDCGHSYVADEVAKLGHNMIVDEAVAPTCTTTGLTEGSHCSRCDHKVAQTVVDALGHNMIVDAAVAPTCTATGLTEGSHCSRCEHKVAQTVVDALGHNMIVDAAVAPTCTATGLTEGSHCSRCDHKVAQTVVDALDHNMIVDAEAVAPTCTTTGLTEGSHCSRCDHKVAQTVVDALGHDEQKQDAKAPTCDAIGWDAYVTCSRCNYTTYVEKEALDHITTNFTGDFLYRVGNQNAVQLSSLFTVGKRSVTVGYTTIVGGASVKVNGTSLEFNGIGVVKVTLSTKDCTCGECVTELTLEVVDAVNATSATSATSNNVVLLNDCGFSSLEVSSGYTLYGNGFTLTCGSDSVALDMGYAFVTLENGTLDNVQIVCPNFDYAVLYKSNMTDSGNRSETTDRTRYYNVKSGVMVSGNSQILNSRISGARAAVNVTGGNCVIENSRLEGGAVASLLIGSANSVTLRDVTLVQKPTASNYDSSKILMGFSVLFICDADGNAAPVTIEGTLVQNAWVDESDKEYVPSAGQSIISTVLGKTDYLHDLDGDGKNESLNLGFAYMPESLTSKVNATTITDNRTNKNDVPYDYVEISVLTGKTYVYSYKNSNGTADSFKTEADYKPNKQGDIITVTYNDTVNGLENVKSFGTSGWVYELNVDLDKATGYKLDFSKLTVVVNGVPVTDYKVNGSAKPASVAVKAGGETYTLTATIDGKEYTATFKVTGTETSKESPSLVANNYQAGLCVASSHGGTWHGAAPALEGIVIKYWSVAEGKYIELNLGDIVIDKKGQLNGTNTTWTYTPANGDYTLTLTGGQVHSSNNVYAMPVGVNGTLYFVAAKSTGLVNSGNSARTIPVSYSFKDNNGGDVLTFSHTWSVAENKDDQYKYSDFCSGTLTKLESSSGGGSCITPDTLITLADGTQVRVDSLTGDEMLLVWNMETGKLDYAPIMFVDSDPAEYVNVVKLKFSDGTEVKVIYEHGFWDYDLNKYVYLDEHAADYIGHTFAKQNGDSLEKVTLVDVVIETEVTTAWSPVTVGHLCYFVNGMLSMPGGVGGLFNIFEVDPDTMTYDFEQIQKDIETYGLYTYEELNAICPLSEDMFNAAGGAYLKISIGKGNLTEAELIEMITRYSKFFD